MLPKNRKYVYDVIWDCSEDLEYFQGPDEGMKPIEFMRESFEMDIFLDLMPIVRDAEDPITIIAARREQMINLRANTVQWRELRMAFIRVSDFILDFLYTMEE